VDGCWFQNPAFHRLSSRPYRPKKVAAALHKCRPTAGSDATGSTIFPNRGDPGATVPATTPAVQPGFISKIKIHGDVVTSILILVFVAM
jgi:hypothetical protein